MLDISKNASTIAPPSRQIGGKHAHVSAAQIQPNALDQAREYLGRVLAWPGGDNASAYVNIVWTRRAAPSGKPIWDGRAVASLDEAISTLKWVLKLQDTFDIYVCMSTQRRAEEKISRGGYKYRKAVRSQGNAVALKSLFLDIDVKGGDNGYPELGAAITQLGNFLNVSGMPKPNVVVQSGGGLHVYLTMDRALTPDQWKPLACALVEATKRHGLKCDTRVTTDCARLLRIPGTFNRKTDPPRPVKLGGSRTGSDYSVEQLEQALAPYKVAAPSRLKPTSAGVLDPAVFPPKPPILDSDLSAGLEADLEQIRSAVEAIPPAALGDEGTWTSLAQALAHHGDQV